MIIGAIVEGLSTCVCRLISRGLNDANVRGATVLDSFFATMLVVLGKLTLYIYMIASKIRTQLILQHLTSLVDILIRR